MPYREEKTNHFIEGVVFPQAVEGAPDYSYDYEQDYRSAVLEAWQSGEITAQCAINELSDVAMPVPGMHTVGPRAERDQWNLEMTAKLEAGIYQPQT